ncbi:hypothetical protein SAMN04487996_102260 [Dyadobacter soli]|uniref:Uncharacterized protein n=1 Tax=Dyadobacter soli TaxID=659014 RepID=A0A1G6XVG9_9BACT|nr:hypothetical protein [Dyadobacter soli]SDD81673.1 hypothetical protein SAMN04487996_102260 [Dyadobacter soli]
MKIYLTGLLIDCAVILAVGCYYLYYVIRKKEPEEPRHYFWIVMASIGAVILVSLFFIYTGDLTTASVMVWLMAVPLIVTVIFILLLIIFRPNWR